MVDQCRWVRDPEIGRYLIPGCWNRAVNGDDAECHCKVNHKRRADNLENLVWLLRQENKRLVAQLEEAKHNVTRPAAYPLSRGTPPSGDSSTKQGDLPSG